MATQTDALASVYARSLYDLAHQAGGEGKVAEIGEELEQICELARGDRTLREFFASPVIDQKRRGDALKTIFADRVSDLTQRFLLVLNDKGRLAHLEAINAAYDALVQEAYGRVEVDVFTAAPLGGEAVESIAARIRSALGKDPVLHAYTDESMIGGLKLRIGDQLIDGSVATRLRRMKQSLLTSDVAAVRERLDDMIEGGAA